MGEKESEVELMDYGERMGYRITCSLAILTSLNVLERDSDVIVDDITGK